MASDSLEFTVKLSGLGDSWMSHEDPAARLQTIIQHSGPKAEVSCKSRSAAKKKTTKK